MLSARLRSAGADHRDDFLPPEHRKEKIHKFGHTHLDDIIERADRFQNELIILSHFSTRYHERQIKSAVERRMPPLAARDPFVDVRRGGIDSATTAR